MSLHPPYNSTIPILFIFFLLICGTGTAESVPDISQISITSVTLTPEVYEPGDRGTVELTIQNRGNSSVQLESVTMTGDGVDILSPSYTLVSPIGGSDTRTYIFDFIAPMEPGVYYPYISVNSVRSGFFKYPVPIRVDTTKPLITIAQMPASFTSGRETTVQIQTANTRPDIIRNAHIVPLTHGEAAAETIDIIPNQYFIGTLGNGEAKIVDFTFTPTIETDLTFVLHYQNGDNKHESEITLPIRFSADKMQAEMALSSVAFSTLDGARQITGDITNIGLVTGYSVTATIGNGANPVYPYKDYVLGTLNADDLTSFQLTFEPLAGSSTAAIIVTFKDSDGNLYTQSIPIDLNGPTSEVSSISRSGGSSGSGGGRGGGGGVMIAGPGMMGGGGGGSSGSGAAPQSSSDSSLLPIVIIILAALGIAFYVLRKKRKDKKGKKSGRKAWKDIQLMKEIESYDAETGADEHADSKNATHMTEEK